MIGMVIERTMLRRLYKLDHLYGLLLTFGLALIIEGALPADLFGVSGQPYAGAGGAAGRRPTSAFMFLPNYRAWVVWPR